MHTNEVNPFYMYAVDALKRHKQRRPASIKNATKSAQIK